MNRYALSVWSVFSQRFLSIDKYSFPMADFVTLLVTSYFLKMDAMFGKNQCWEHLLNAN